jgi:hypothetical protein
VQAPADPICPLCGRPIPSGAPQSDHHLVPRLKGGARGPVVRLHQICHNAIHAAPTEAEIAEGFSDIAALRGDPRLARFAAWVACRPPGFHAHTAGGRRQRKA